jgi:transposase
MGEKYDREFKLEAIRMATEEGHQATEVERRLGIGQGMISRWQRQLRTNGEEAFPGTGHLSTHDAQRSEMQAYSSSSTCTSRGMWSEAASKPPLRNEGAASS